MNTYRIEEKHVMNNPRSLQCLLHWRGFLAAETSPCIHGKPKKDQLVLGKIEEGSAQNKEKYSHYRITLISELSC